MKTLAGPVLAALASGNVVLVQFIHFAFPAGVVAINTSTWDLLWGGVTYKGAYGMGTVSSVVDKPGEVQGITLQFAAGDPASIALALDSADQVQGTFVTIRTAIVDATTYAVLDAPIDWLGKCDTMAINEDGGQAMISVSAESGAVDLLRGNPSTYNDADQQAGYAGDRAFEYVVSQVDKPVVWPSREYFLK